ncbi:YfgG family protein [uncultured Pantoea sp.]|uniref:YfgG family protein n=1 Tax=uncultured Pantoea sp. TaxID=218084 RepID=UPI0025909F45|nr:YfgG family protein [uncultured Pantoea sp.]
MNSAISPRRRQKTGTMTRIVLLISFIILVSRLIFILPAAFEHHQQQKTIPEPVVITTGDTR